MTQERFSIPLSHCIQVKVESEPGHKIMLMVPMILRSQGGKGDHVVESVSAVWRKRIVETVSTASKLM